MVPALVVNAIRSGVLALEGPALAAFGKSLSARIGVALTGNASTMYNSIAGYVTSNPMTAALTIASLASATPNFNLEALKDMWKGNGDLPDEVAHLLERLDDVREQRNSITGDGEEDTVLGMKTDELRKAALLLKVGDEMIEDGIRFCGNLNAFIRLRQAILSVDDAQIALYQERH